jgi:hypothetical protein
VTYTQWKNRVIERKNQTMLDMVQSMTKMKKISKKFLAETMQCAMYIQN